MRRFVEVEVVKADMDRFSFLRWKVEDRIATVSGDQLARLGGAIAAVPEGEVLEAAYTHACLIARHSSPILATAKWSLNTVESMILQPGYIFEQSLTGEISGHPDSVEAFRAALERRALSYLPPEQPAGQAVNQRRDQR